MENNASILNGNLTWREGTVYNDPLSSFTANLVKSGVYVVIQIFGLAGNFLVISAVVSQRRLHNSYYILVSQLAFCDIGVLLCSIIEWHIFPWSGLMESSQITVRMVCKVWLTSNWWFYTTGIFFLVFIAVLRYKTVVKPFDQPIGRKRLFHVIALVYLFALFLEIPYFLSLDFTHGYCADTWYKHPDDILLYDLYAQSLPFLQFILPIIFLALLYAKLCWSLYLQSNNVKSLFVTPSSSSNREITNGSSLVARQARNTKVVVTSMTVVALFVASKLPVQVQRMVVLSTGKYEVVHGLWITMLYHIGSSCVNPFVYAFCDKAVLGTFKKIFRKVFFCNKPGRSEVVTPNSGSQL